MRKSWGKDFQTYTDEQRRRDAAAARGLRRAAARAVRPRLELVGLRRRARRSRCARTRCPQPISPYGVTKLAAEQLGYLYHVNHGVPARRDALLHGLRAAAASRHGVPPVHPRRAEGRADHALRRRRADARLHVRRRRGGGDDRRPASAACPGTAYNIGGGSRVSMNEVLRDHRADRRPSAEDRARRPAEGRHARHYADTSLARARPRIRPEGLARTRDLEAEYRWLSSLPCARHDAASAPS